MQEILTVRNVTKAFGSKVAVDNISFSVKRGEILGFLGPNGAGKTTSIRMIMGIIDQDEGEILFQFDGRTGPLDKQKIGYLPEERGLYYDGKVIENLLYLASLKGQDPRSIRQDALRWLERVGLAEYANQKLEKLSKGMQQKVQFIAALLHKPELIMLDEPFSGLDPINQNFFKAIIQELREQGVTILFSAHQMNLVEEICDSIFLINQGKPVLHGNLRQIKQGYQEYIVQVRYENLQIPADTQLVVERQTEDGVSIRYRGAGPVNDLMSELSRWGAIAEVSINKPPLHDIFIHTVKEKGGQLSETQAS